MIGEQAGGKRRKRRHMTAAEKYQVWLEVVTGQGTQREIADRWGVDRSTVVHIVKTAKQGRWTGWRRPDRAGRGRPPSRWPLRMLR
jgi:transposase-like protein